VILDELPADPASERALVASVLVDPTVLDDLQVSGGDFRDSMLGRIYEALAICREAGVPTYDAAVLVAELRSQKIDVELMWLAKLIGEGIASNARFYARAVKRASGVRKLHDATREAIVRLHAADANVGDVRAFLETRLAALDDVGTDEAKTVRTLAAELLMQLATSEPERRCCMSGIYSHDERAGGWMPGELIVLAARTGLGKTALATQIARHNAERGRSVLFVSLEMRGVEIVGRILCGDARVDSRRLRAMTLEPFHVKAIREAASVLKDSGFRIWAPPRAGIQQIRGMCRRLAKQCGLDLLVVDYVGLVQASDRRRERYEQIGQITGDLKSLGREMQVPVLALHQLNREADKGGEPKLSHLRESGAVEQDADVVLFLHQDKTTTKLIIAKHRHGQRGSIELDWHGLTTRFTDKEPSNRVSAFDAWNGGSN
jgi:replicative DNA helicase